MTIPIQAADITWVGGNGSYELTSNWSTVSIPLEADRAIFNDSALIPNYAVGVNLDETLGDALFSATSDGVFWKANTSTWTVVNSFILDQSAGATALARLRNGITAVTNVGGTAVFKVGDYTSGGKGLFTMERQSADDTSISNYPTLIADSFLVTSNSTFNFNAGTLTTYGSTIDRGQNVFFDVAPVAGGVATWNILGGTNSINYIGTIGTNRLAFTAGGTVNVNVSGSNTLWLVNGGEFNIGWNGIVNLAISGGAQVTNRGIASISRNGVGTSNNTVIVTGPGSQWNLGNELYVGRAARNNSLTISDGGVVNGTAGRIGDPAGSSNNVVTVTGTDSRWNMTDLLQIGVIGRYNTLIITNGGQVVSGGATASTRLGRDATSISNTAIVDGASSQWTVTSNSLVVGNSGAFNNVTVKNGGQFVSLGLTIGAGASSSNNGVLIDGSGTLWNNTSGVIMVGSAGGGNQLTLSNGAELRTVSTFDVSPGAGSGNSALVSGGTLAVTNSSSGATIRVGGTGALGTFTFNGGTIFVDKLFLMNGAASAFNFNGGVLNVLSSQVSKASAFLVGNGTSSAQLNLLGTSHAFDDGLTISSNASLTGIGTILGNVTLANGSVWAPGLSAGTQTVVGAATLNAGTVLNYDLGAPGDPADLIEVTGNLTLDGTINVANLGSLANGQYVIFTYGSLSDNGLNVGTMPGSFSGTVSNDAGNSQILLLVSGGPVGDPFTTWQDLYFPGDPVNGAPDADPDGDGVTNTNEFLAGFNPTINAAYPHVISAVRSGNDINITYLGANGDSSYSGGPAARTNVLEFTTGTANGGYTNNFVSTGLTNVLSGGTGVGVITNIVETGGASNTPSRYYRIRVLAP